MATVKKDQHKMSFFWKSQNHDSHEGVGGFFLFFGFLDTRLCLYFCFGWFIAPSLFLHTHKRASIYIWWRFGSRRAQAGRVQNMASEQEQRLQHDILL